MIGNTFVHQALQRLTLFNISHLPDKNHESNYVVAVIAWSL
ncbi:hypothetical protein APA_5328 [Pseudanabaena sp. lw0831]|nr:hypothetical protein APA_5328 [Pseudanabaena sp. lw0831]